MVIIETSVFTRRRPDYLDDEAYRDLQNMLVNSPKSGKVIQGGGGLRKVRYGYNNLGKSKSLRVIYYFKEDSMKLLLLFLYAKNEAEDLTPAQIAALRKALGSV